MSDDEPRVRFLKRWFGYCATGETREANMVLHIGAGSNGKSTLVDTMHELLGKYAFTAPPGLLTSLTSADRHPTELAALQGKRLVTSHESDDGAVLREALVKQSISGGKDSITARFMRQDFFEFKPTHKVQLLTNYKPTVRGQDYAIWRRLLLVNYYEQFGTEEELQSKRVGHLADLGLARKLEAEREGIFRWLVEGAVEWYEDGLRPPESVIAAGREYQSEQDRIAQFVSECCIRDPSAWAPFGGPFGGLYPAYTHWCRQSGYQAMGINRFTNELSRVVPGFKRVTKETRRDGIRKNVKGAYGVRVNDDMDGGGSVEIGGDLV